MHQYNGKNLNKLINQYNATQAGTLTPAGKALVSAGLFTQQQLVTLAGRSAAYRCRLPENHGPENAFYRNMDLNISYPIRLETVPGGHGPGAGNRVL